MRNLNRQISPHSDAIRYLLAIKTLLNKYGYSSKVVTGAVYLTQGDGWPLNLGIQFYLLALLTKARFHKVLKELSIWIKKQYIVLTVESGFICV